MTSWSACPHGANYRTVPPRTVTVGGNVGPFIGMTGVVVAEDDELVWVRFEQGGSYEPCDKPGVYGLHRDQLSAAPDPARTESTECVDCGHQVPHEDGYLPSECDHCHADLVREHEGEPLDYADAGDCRDEHHWSL